MRIKTAFLIMPPTFKTLILVLLISFSLLAVSKVANADEELDLELLCEGTASYVFGSPETDDGLELLLVAGVISELENELHNFEERFSIEKNQLGDVTLVVSDTFIKLPEDGKADLIDEFNDEIASEAGFKVLDFNATLDRLTGKLDAKLEVQAIKGGALETSVDIDFIKKVWSAVESIDVSGQCEKLDPKKKKF